MGESATIEPWAPGQPAPRFDIEGEGGRRVAFDSLAGRYLVMAFLGRAGQEESARAIREAMEREALIDGKDRALLWVTADPADRGRIPSDGVRFGIIWDYDLAVSRQFHLVRPASEGFAYRPCWIVLDPRLRVLKSAPIAAAREVMEFLAALPRPGDLDGQPAAPVLILPRVLEPELCERLIGLYEAGTPEEGGFMRQIEGKTVRVQDRAFKRRADVVIEDEELRGVLRARLAHRLVPEVRRAFQFDATRIERYIVSCYDADGGGFFKPHRDNTTTGTAHRKFAVTINLNAEAYEGGDLRFPEFGERLYRAPTGGAVVFSCSLMHEAMPVTSGRRYAFLPFLYDEAGAMVREQNLHTLADPALRSDGGSNPPP